MNKKDFLNLVMETIESLPDTVIIERMEITEESVVTYPLYDAIKYLEFKGHGEYSWLMSIAHDIKNSCFDDLYQLVEYTKFRISGRTSPGVPLLLDA